MRPRPSFAGVAPNIRRSMQGNRSSGTKPELILRQALWKDGLRGYRKNVRSLPGKPDLVFGRLRLAVFVQGCFWHRCPHCIRNLSPHANAEFWEEKFRRNVERDVKAQIALTSLGFQVLLVWECELKKDLGRIVARIKEALEDKIEGQV